jgi:hypothetical protein
MTAPQKPETFCSDLSKLPPALHFLTTQRRWVLWRWSLRPSKNGTDKWTKPPYRIDNPNVSAKSNDPSTWGDYADAVAAVTAGLADGIGFMLLDSEMAAADADKCRDAKTGTLSGWVQRICVEASSLGLYCEVTVSGTGLRFIGLSHQGKRLSRRFPFNRTSGEGLELYRNCERFITISGLQEGTCESLGEIDAYLDELAERFGKVIPPAIPTLPVILDLNNIPLSNLSTYYQDILENGVPEGQRSEAFAEIVWHLASKGMSAEEIEAELRKHPNGIGAKYAKRLPVEVTRCFNKWRARRQASVAGTASSISPTSSSPWPQIHVIPSELPRVVNEAEDALCLLNEEIYQRGGILMRPVRNTVIDKDGRLKGWELIPVEPAFLVNMLCRAAQFLRHDKRTHAWIAIDAPQQVAAALLANRGRWEKLPLLKGIVNAPFLRVDGSICATPGYDAESKLLFTDSDCSFPPNPDQPSRDDAVAALKVLEDLIGTFPFMTRADKSVMLAAMLTVLDRKSITATPLFGITSPMQGTGKSLLVDVCSMLATGDRIAVMNARNEIEMEKQLGANLLAGRSVISIDNVHKDIELSSDYLCQMLTQAKVDVRVLGESRSVECQSCATIFATGNNLQITGDLTRRSLLCSIDAGVERPELRSFGLSLLEELEDRRGEVVVAALTVLRAWQISGERIQAAGFRQLRRLVVPDQGVPRVVGSG